MCSEVNLRKMRYLHALLLSILASAYPVLAQSSLLENVKRNPKEAIALCKQFRSLNAEGISSSSKEALESFSRQKNLSLLDAEILSTYVIGMNCPDVN